MCVRRKRRNVEDVITNVQRVRSSTAGSKDCQLINFGGDNNDISSFSTLNDASPNDQQQPGCSSWSSDSPLFSTEEDNNVASPHSTLEDVPPNHQSGSSSKNADHIDHQDNNLSCQSAPETIHSALPTGRRIVDIEYFLQNIFNGEKHSVYGCSIADMDVVSETRKGLYSNFLMK